MRTLALWGVGGLVVLLSSSWAAAQYPYGYPNPRAALAAAAGAMSDHAQQLQNVVQYIPGGEALQINARRLAESIEHVRREAIRGASDEDLRRDFERARIDYDFLGRDLQTVYGSAPPAQLAHEWQHISRAYQSLTGIMAQGLSANDYRPGPPVVWPRPGAVPPR